MLDHDRAVDRAMAECRAGRSGWRPYHALGTDATHTNAAGAAAVADLVRDLVREANLTALVSRMR